MNRPAAVLWALGAFLVAAMSVAPPASAVPTVVRAPLAGAVTTASGSWAVLPMGNLRDPDNTFWQLFFQVPGASHWSLVTPPGVADNGGLVGAHSTASLVGILPSHLLLFTPLAQSADNGANWSPGLLSAALSPLPDALAFQAASAGAPGRALALIGRRRVLSTSAALRGWSSLVTAKTLRTSASWCGLGNLDAVALGPGATPVVAAGCSRGRRAGIFAGAGGSWRPVGPVLGGASTASEVLRLAVTAANTTVLVATDRRGRRALVGASQPTGGAWSTSAPLGLAAGDSLLSTSVGADGELAVLLGGPSGRLTTFVLPPGGTWARLPAPPTETLTLSVSPVAVTAFSVNGPNLHVFTLTSGATNWVRTQTSVVPIAYGSSG